MEALRVAARISVPLLRGIDARTGSSSSRSQVAVHGVRRAGIDGSERVLVVGGGTIGLRARRGGDERRRRGRVRRAIRRRSRRGDSSGPSSSSRGRAATTTSYC
ncbi:MAG: hypothetical protein R3E53_19630 [Myxococcota bacterium]